MTHKERIAIGKKMIENAIDLMSGKTPEPQVRNILKIHQTRPPKSITFWAIPEIAESFSKFGQIINFSTNGFHLFIDARYDFTEVLEYIRSFESFEITGANNG